MSVISKEVFKSQKKKTLKWKLMINMEIHKEKHRSLTACQLMG